jgi:hypothetical protein
MVNGPVWMLRLGLKQKVPQHNVPLIMLQGEWLRRAGFDQGSTVLVTVETKRLVKDVEKRNGD